MMPLDHELSMVKNMIIVKKMTKLFNELDQHGIYFVFKTLVSLKSQIRNHYKKICNKILDFVV